ncbi:hypothetical protein BCR44DRAFT_119523 [Catenaria anguillulae PL171]|uniref:Actin-like ATPase domain-containing protein n=1 Tax=Catenaria anguillulae PL171 TaxID=765915 RepID=A0A1Y2HUK4_9FUNG|nr:hypothetical protein BCR44DRAFT_119523 [Catenaria anguillulae PL171]
MSLRSPQVGAGGQQQQQQLRSALKHSPKHRPANPPDNNLRPDSGIGSPAQTQQQQQQSGVTPLAPAEVVAHDVSKIRYCVGLDFGTTYSGFAIVQMQSDPTKLQPVTPLNWPDQPPNVTGVKTPTISCYAKDNLALDSWGFTAMKKNTMKVHKIERVKLCLEPSTPEFLKPIIPEGLQADDIIRDYLREVDGYCMQTLDRMWGVSFGKGDIAKDEIMYCLTVPVNWSAESHQRLRRAAYRAGLITTERSPNLVFCYEPEAACMACVHDPDVQLRPGSEFLVVDCGGGTVDLFQCRIGQTDDPRSAPELVELSMGQGGFFGATNVDVAFLNYLGELMTPLGLENVSHSPRCAAAWNNLLSQWEYRKRSFTGSESAIDEIFVPQAILRELEDTLDGQLPEALEGGTIELDPQRMRSFFDPVLDSIIRLVQTQIHSLVTNGDAGATASGALVGSNGSGTVLEHMFVVGGFGNSAYLRKRIADDPVIKKLVNRVRSIPSPEVAVLRGAVYAAVGDSIRSRRARRSIGVQILRPFDPQVDEERDVVYRAPDQPRNQAFWLVDSYVEAFIQKGDPVQMSSHYAKHHFSLSPGSWTADINIFASDVRRPLLHTRRDKCDFLGRVTIDARPFYPPNSPSSGSFHGSARDSMVSVAPSTSSGVGGGGANANWSKRDLSISIYFGRVELEVCVTDTESGRTWRTILGHGHIHVR